VIASVLMGDVRWHVERGDALDVLRTIPDASFDALLCDPPAGIGFMGKGWDKDKGGRDEWVAWLAAIMREAIRCMRPGAYGLVWALPRTSHWTGLALEDAGFEVRDRVSHLFGSGFPKSLNVSKAVDSALGAERPITGERVLTGNAAVSLSDKRGTYGVQVGTVPPKTVAITGPATPEAARWEGYGTALKPACEDWWLVRKPLDGTVAHNATTHGTGGINIDGCRIGDAGGTTKAERTPDAETRGAYGRGLNGSCAAALPAGRWPANLALSHTEDCRLLGTVTERRVVSVTIAPGQPTKSAYGNGLNRRPEDKFSQEQEQEQWECSPNCPIKLLDDQAGDCPGMSGGGEHSAEYGGGMFGAIDAPHLARNDSGGPSRFFYCAKASTAEREFGCEDLPRRTVSEMTDREEGAAGLDSPRAGAGRGGGAHNFHPTIKSVALAKWLATLLLPPARSGHRRRALTPFAGSGTEMIGALRAGFESSLGIEQD
jgi:hypothetical protein